MKFGLAMYVSWKKPITKKFYRWTFEEIEKFGQKTKNFEIFLNVHMVTSVIVSNIKKIFKIFNFLAKFFPWSAHAQPQKKIFFAKKFIFVHIFILDVHIYCQNVHLGLRNSLYMSFLQWISECQKHILTINMDI